jgi:hypothetical protein
VVLLAAAIDYLTVVKKHSKFVLFQLSSRMSYAKTTDSLMILECRPNLNQGGFADSDHGPLRSPYRFHLAHRERGDRGKLGRRAPYGPATEPRALPSRTRRPAHS